MAAVVIAGSSNINIYRQAFSDYKSGPKLVFKIDELKELKKKQYICPQDIKHVGSTKYYGPALSGILGRPYYSDISMTDKFASWHVSVRFAAETKQQVKNPCLSQYE